VSLPHVVGLSLMGSRGRQKRRKEASGNGQVSIEVEGTTQKDGAARSFALLLYVPICVHISFLAMAFALCVGVYGCVLKIFFVDTFPD
jgi:hypothetical protein